MRSGSNCGSRIVDSPLGNVEIINCVFSEMKSDSNGGVISYKDKTGVYVSLQDCMFDHCQSSKGGGAIYFTCPTDSSFDTKRVCGYLCHGMFMHFGFFQVSNGKSNTYELVTINHCYNNTDEGHWDTFCIQGGNQKVNGVNSSKNIGIESPGMHSIQPESLQASFCTFAHNFALEDYIVSFQSGLSVLYLSYANIINSSFVSGYTGVLSSSSNDVRVSNCVFVGNMKALFAANENGKITVSDSVICHIKGNITKGSVTMGQNITITNDENIPTLGFTHYVTYYCFADKPFSGDSPIWHSVLIIASVVSVIVFLVVVYFNSNFFNKQLDGYSKA